MANAFSKEEVVFFDQMLAGFDPNNITARQVSKYKPDGVRFERGGMTVHRPLPEISKVVTGQSITATDITQLTVPSALNLTSNILNVPFKMSAWELKDAQQRDRKATSAVQAIAANIDNTVATAIANQGTLFVKQTAAITTYNQAAACKTAQTIRDVPMQQPRTLILNATDAAGMAGNLANRDAPLAGTSLSAYERSALPPIAGFDTFEASFNPTIAAAAGTSKTVNGANQRHVPLATDANGLNVDNRSQILTVNSGADIAVGDAFTIAGVFAVSHIHKNVTSELQTFRVLAVNGANLTISPAIISADSSPTQAEIEYQNCSAAPANSAAITFLNTVAAPANTFFVNDAVEIIHGDISQIDLNEGGVATMTGTTDSGIQILMAKQGAIGDLTMTYRFTAWVGATVLVPDMCGVMVGSQT
mgnify:CR=1 FL=1